jgi:hypothetical protein
MRMMLQPLNSNSIEQSIAKEISRNGKKRFRSYYIYTQNIRKTKRNRGEEYST